MEMPRRSEYVCNPAERYETTNQKHQTGNPCHHSYCYNHYSSNAHSAENKLRHSEYPRNGPAVLYPERTGTGYDVESVAPIQYKFLNSPQTVPENCSYATSRRYVPEAPPRNYVPRNSNYSSETCVIKTEILSNSVNTDEEHAEEGEDDFSNNDSSGFANSERLLEEKCVKSENESPTCTSETQDSNSTAKPSMSYIALIGKAILESPHKRLNLGSIYSWIEHSYPYFTNKGQGWRNSVRHNLSLNDCFVKAGRCEDGKGNYWAIHPANLQDFLQGDFRQRRRSRRRGRKRDQEMNIYQMSAGMVPPAASPPTSFPSMGINALNPMTFNSFYSPYTDAERRAYKLDEALRQQGMSTQFWNLVNSNSYSPGVSGVNINPGMYGSPPTQWSGYHDNSSQAMFQFNNSFPRHPV